MANLGDARKKKAAQKSGALARLKERKTNGPVPEPETLAALGVHQGHDFMVNGVRYHSPRFLGRINDRPWGSVDVTNGIKTYTLTNQFGSWMMPDADGYLKEPAALGLGSQLEVSTNLIARFDAFLVDMGIQTAAEKRARLAAEEKAKREREKEQSKRLDTLVKAKNKRLGAIAKLKKGKSA
jgi:hypothetical protein